MKPLRMDLTGTRRSIVGMTRLVRRPARARAIPLSTEFLAKCAAVYLGLFKDFCVVNAEVIPASGPLILVANHSAVYDPVCLQVACRTRHIRFMEAREYYDVALLRRAYQALGVIPVNRNGNDTASIRTALRELANNGCIGIFPEGRISNDGQIQQAQEGVALLALASNAIVVPAYVRGTEPYSGMISDFLRFNRVTLCFGQPVTFEDLAGRHRDKDARRVALKRIMDAIQTLQRESASRAAK